MPATIFSEEALLFDASEQLATRHRLISIRKVGLKDSSDFTEAKAIQSHLSVISRYSTRVTFHELLHREIQKCLAVRSNYRVYDVKGGKNDVTPKLINLVIDRPRHKLLDAKFPEYSGKDTGSFRSVRSGTSSISRHKSTRGLGMKISIDDVILGIGSDRLLVHFDPAYAHLAHESDTSSYDDSSLPEITIYTLPFIRIVLWKSDLIHLYEQRSVTVPANTDESKLVLKDNDLYEYLVSHRGRMRRRSEAEAQTNLVFRKTRDINTDPVVTTSTASYVSFYEMFDTYQMLNKFSQTKPIVQEEKHVKIPLHKLPYDEQVDALGRLPAFNLGAMIIMRLLAGNEHSKAQKRFRKMKIVDRMVKQINYKYSLLPLFTLYPNTTEGMRRAVCDISFCAKNTDILAVAYGIYSYSAAKLSRTGSVCVWSIKNPCNPERQYNFDYPVVSISFSPYLATLLAIGLFDGSVEVRDVTEYNKPPVAISQRSTAICVDPVLSIKWIKQAKASDSTEIDPLLALSQDGSVTKFNIINSPYLAGFKQTVLECVEGTPEGLSFKMPQELETQTIRRPQGLSLTKHPLQHDIFYILTDEGCLHKCSTNYQNQYLELLKTHDGAVNCMDFSPWSPKLFLTCGNDWCLRIWMDGIFKPLITITNLCAPYQWANWSRTHSTILLGINRKQVEIWDIRRSVLKPMSTTFLENSFNTLAKFSRDGYNIAVGNEKGNVHINAFDEMPFPSYFQYEALEKAIYKAITTDPDLLIELRSVGFFGYPNKARVLT
uniref:Dynein axonemal intermediate chain 4 n=1 Tax=Glossina brevipalpis TaxID=37001 RepID=A0A1A9WPR9_9MUSC